MSNKWHEFVVYAKTDEDPAIFRDRIARVAQDAKIQSMVVYKGELSEHLVPKFDRIIEEIEKGRTDLTS